MEGAPNEIPSTFGFFCYGSLRPDDDSGMPWTKDAVLLMNAQPASISGAKLYEDTYASLVFDNCGDDDTCKRTSSVVIGWVLTCSDPALFQRKLEQFDRIEGYIPNNKNSIYQRAIANVCLGDPTMAIGDPVGAQGSLVRAYVYHRPDRHKKYRIQSGDWLKRGLSKNK